MTRQEIMEAIKEEWLAFINVAENFPETEMHISGAVGYWTVYDALIHVAAWDIESVKAVDNYLAKGEYPEWQDWPGTQIDELNENMVAEKRSLSTEEIWQYFKDCHDQLIQSLNRYEDSVFQEGSFTVGIINSETWQHYKGHNQDLVNFKMSR